MPFATEIAPKLSQNAFNRLMGHSKRSNLQEVYVNDLGTEGNRKLLISRGIIIREETISSARLEIQPKYCFDDWDDNNNSGGGGDDNLETNKPSGI
jgi:hypothetical protein